MNPLLFFLCFVFRSRRVRRSLAFVFVFAPAVVFWSCRPLRSPALAFVRFVLLSFPELVPRCAVCGRACPSLSCVGCGVRLFAW